MDFERKFHLYKWALYIVAIVLIGLNSVTFYRDFIVGTNIDGALLSLVFIMLGLLMILKERQSVREFERRKQVNKISEKFDDDTRRAIDFVVLNSRAMDGPQEKWIHVASQLYGKEPTEIVNALNEVQADMEILARTGDLPDEYKRE